MDMQDVSNLVIPEGQVRTIHDKDNRLLWGKVAYDVKYAGDSSQQTYSGKNLAKVTECNISTSSYSLVISNGSVDINSITSNNWFDICGGQRTGDWVPTNVASVADYNLTSADEGTYVLSIQNFSYTNTANQNAQVHVITNQRRIGTSITRGATSFEPKVFTLEADEYVKMIGVWIGATGTGELKGEFQLEVGSQPSSFEPYTGGAPAPNPDYPQPIQVVTGEQTVNISDGSITSQFVVNLSSKNLFNVDGDFNYGSANHQTTSNGDGTITTTSRFSSSRSSGQKIDNLLPNTVYTLTATIDSYTGSGKPNAAIVQILNSSSGSVSVIKNIYFAVASGVPNTISETFTTPADVSAIWVSFNGDTTPGSGVAASATFSHIQIEKGNATVYSPYYYYELAKINAHTDYIYPSSDGWHIHNDIQKIASYNGETMTTDYMSTTGQLTTGATVYYVLSSPADTLITDTTLISQLDAIHEWMTRYGYNATVTGNLPIIIDRTNL